MAICLAAIRGVTSVNSDAARSLLFDITPKIVVLLVGTALASHIVSEQAALNL